MSAGWSLALLLFGACATSEPRVLADEIATVGCGMCVFHMENAESCFWAIEIDGTYWPVRGEVPGDDEHDAHAADGMCSVARTALVSGSLEGGQFTATRFDLQPAAGTQPSGESTHVHAH